MVVYYEDLRGLVLSGIGKGLGLALFLRQGMKAWIVTCAQWSVPTPRQNTSLVPGDRWLPLDSRDQIALILAGMALNGYFEAKP